MADMVQVEQPKDFNGRVFELMKGALNIKGDLTALRDAPEEEPTAAKVSSMTLSRHHHHLPLPRALQQFAQWQLPLHAQEGRILSKVLQAF